MSAVAIRIPSVGALFDAWSPEPLERRPLSDDARERIVDAWIEARNRGGEPPPSSLTLALPASERAEGLEAALVAALRHDMEAMAVDARRHWIRRSFERRETRIGLVVFFLALVAAALLDYDANDGSVETIVSQTFVVLAWVALWEPAHRLITSTSYRLGRRSFAELATTAISVRWD